MQLVITTSFCLFLERHLKNGNFENGTNDKIRRSLTYTSILVERQNESSSTFHANLIIAFAQIHTSGRLMTGILFTKFFGIYFVFSLVYL